MFSQASFRPSTHPPRPSNYHNHDSTPSSASPLAAPLASEAPSASATATASPAISSTPATPSPRSEVVPLGEATDGSKSDTDTDGEHLHAPSPRPHDSLRPPAVTHAIQKDKEIMDDYPSSPSSYTSRYSRTSASPSRHHGLTALSPLQAFSPLQPTRQAPSSKAPSEAGSLRTRSRTSSVTKSLSRRDSLIAAAARWGHGDEPPPTDEDFDNVNSFFSRLTLVKAPAEKSGLTKHNRSKSSSSLVPFSTFAAASDTPATSNRGPRRSFAASSFGGLSAISKPTTIRTHSYSDDNDIQSRRKPLSPDQVVDIARSLNSPVMLPEKGSLLRRRKSAGATFRLSLKDDKPSSNEKEPVALEPVEYKQMDEGVFLPYIDRAAEVDELIRHPANDKLFKLLKAAFPKHPARSDWKRLQPEEWNWEELILHLTSIDRDEMGDYRWIFRARQAVRQRSISLWEKLGTCLGCDGDLLNAGGEDDIPPSWGGLGLGDEGEYDPTMNQVWIEGLEAVDPNEAARAENDLAAVFGEIVEDEGEQAAAGMTALLDPIGEGEGDEPARFGPTTAQRAGNVHKVDPLNDLSHDTPPRGFTAKPTANAGADGRPSRSKSFVGLQIRTAPTSPPQNFVRSPVSQLQTPIMEPAAALPIYERGPGSPMFPSSFSSLSAGPNLGRSASVALAQAGLPPAVHEDFKMMRRGLVRKSSGAGLSESAITFASESDYATSHGDH